MPRQRYTVADVWEILVPNVRLAYCVFNSASYTRSAAKRALRDILWEKWL